MGRATSPQCALEDAPPPTPTPTPPPLPSGTNHVLPTYGYTRMYSGVGLDTFQKQMTVQTLTAEGLAALGPAVAKMAAVEGLDAHRRAVTLRLGTSSPDKFD